MTPTLNSTPAPGAEAKPGGLIPSTAGLGSPHRIQLSRAKGWRMPPNTVKVDRSTKWGNPYRVGDIVHRGPAFSGRDEIIVDAAQAVRAYRKWIFNLREAEKIPPLRGKNLACWCPIGSPCHADVLLELANADPHSPSPSEAA